MFSIWPKGHDTNTDTCPTCHQKGGHTVISQGDQTLTLQCTTGHRFEVVLTADEQHAAVVEAALGRGPW